MGRCLSPPVSIYAKSESRSLLRRLAERTALSVSSPKRVLSTHASIFVSPLIEPSLSSPPGCSVLPAARIQAKMADCSEPPSDNTALAAAVHLFCSDSVQFKDTLGMFLGKE